jgi:hypothetical protein
MKKTIIAICIASSVITADAGDEVRKLSSTKMSKI